MAYATDRVILYSRTYEPMGDLAPDEVISRVRHEVINLEHTLTLVTTRPLAEGTRILTQDGTGKWREWVVSTPDDKHETGEHAIGTYVCIWSLQYDLMGCDDGAHAEPGMGSSCTGALAVAAALDGTDRWEVGSVDVAAVEAGKGCVMTIGKTAWERMSLVVDKWGGEVDAEIEVDSAGVVSRAVALRAHLGQTSVTRRFDWGHDLKSIRRTPEPGPRYCGIVPLGRGQTEYAEDDETTFEWPLTLTGDPEYYPEYTEDYILDPEASLAFRVPDGNGGWEYPKKTVTYDTDDVGELYELASADLYDQTHPKVTYEGDVLQFAAAGMEAQGVQLGDEVQTVDHGFAVDAPLHIQGRVVELEVNELSPRTDTHLVIGYVSETVASLLSSTISSAVTPLSRRISRIEGDTSIVHLQDLIDALNAEINATGGWWYAVPGMGTRTYDTAVTDPAVGTEASKVVEIRGGSIRIANSRTSGGDWDWKTLIVSGHIAAELVTAVNVTAGWIGNPSGTTFFDIDNDQLVIGGRTESQIMDELDSAGIDKIEYGTSASSSTEPQTWNETVPSSVSKGSWLWIRTTYNDGGTSVTKAYAGTDGQNGADGEDGEDGVGIASTVIEYGTSADAATQPSAWSTTPPTSLPQATWLWVCTTYTYSDQSTKSVYTKSYVGTDGEDGASVYVASSTKSGDTTTVVLSDGTTLTIVDGEDGTNGTNGLNGYVHTAWANSADGSADFSTTVSANKLYLGVYTDNAQADSQSPSAYSWSLIKGADGVDGTDGYNTATILLYQRAASQPSKPSSALTYTFASHSLSGSLGSWSTSVPGGTDPCWVTAATATSNTATDTIESTEWVTPTKLVENGADGNGIASETVSYGTSASAGTQPSSWQSTIPTVAEGQYLWTRKVTDYTDPNVADTVTYAYVKQGAKGDAGSAGTSVSVTSIEYQTGSSATTAPTGPWSSSPYDTTASNPYLWTKTTFSDNNVAYGVAKRGDAGTDGLNQATVLLYKRSASAPTRPLNQLTYTFATGALSGTLDGWTRTVPASDGYPCWVTSAAAIASGATDSIYYADWSTPTKLVEDGKEGRNYVCDTAAFDNWDVSSYMAVEGGNLRLAYDGTALNAKSMPLIRLSAIDKELVTLSMKVRGYAGRSCTIYFEIVATSGPDSRVSIGYKQYSLSFTGSADWQDVKTSFTPDSSSFSGTSASFDPETAYFYLKMYLYVSGWSQSDGVFYAYVRGESLQLEKGGAASAWSAALEDHVGEDGIGVSDILEQYLLTTMDGSTPALTPTGNESGWSTAQPAWESGKHIWTMNIVTWTDGSQSKTSPVLAKAINGANQTASNANSVASAASTKADGAGSRQQTIYYSKASASPAVAAETTWVTDVTGAQGTWTTKRPQYDRQKPVLFVATQSQTVAQRAAGNTCDCTTPVVDETTTVIDGGHITTGTIDAGVVNVTNLDADNITSGTISADKVSGGTLQGVQVIQETSTRKIVLDNDGIIKFFRKAASDTTWTRIGTIQADSMSSGGFLNIYAPDWMQLGTSTSDGKVYEVTGGVYPSNGSHGGTKAYSGEVQIPYSYYDGSSMHSSTLRLQIVHGRITGIYGDNVTKTDW